MPTLDASVQNSTEIIPFNPDKTPRVSSIIMPIFTDRHFTEGLRTLGCISLVHISDRCSREDSVSGSSNFCTFLSNEIILFQKVLMLDTVFDN